MIATVKSSQETFDPFAQTSRIVKHSDFRLLGRFFPKTSVKRSPSFAHFVKPRPKHIYNEISEKLRAHFHVESYRF